MEIANAWLKVAPGHEIPMTDVTPAECVILNTGHEANANGIAVFMINNIRSVPRMNADEIKRLRAAYRQLTDKNKKPIADILYPGVSPQLPQTFHEAGLVEGAAPKAVEVPKPVEAAKVTVLEPGIKKV